MDLNRSTHLRIIKNILAFFLTNNGDKRTLGVVTGDRQTAYVRQHAGPGVSHPHHAPVLRGGVLW